LKAWKMPPSLRQILVRGAGKVIRGSSPRETSRKLADELKNCHYVVAVGDVVCASLLRMDKVPDICVIDGKTKRGPYRMPEELLKNSFNMVTKVRNPASHITDEALQALKNAWRTINLGVKTLIMVDGEEDLLALAASTIAVPGSCILYGLPDVGIGVIELDEALKKEAIRLFRMFKEVSV
jgi:uncharacterized protein (UPF0218 family)